MFKLLIIPLLSTLALAATPPTTCNGTPASSYTLGLLLPGANEPQTLQIRRDQVVYGLSQGFSEFHVTPQGNFIDIVSPGFNEPRELYVDCDGKLLVSDAGSPTSNAGREGTFSLVGEGNQLTVQNNGESIFYSCSNPSEPIRGGQQVYAKTGDSFVCPDPVVGTLVAIKQ
ncbi:hypothetical protein CJU89_0343 [Yarrowia sp. B02]|nr:hypothetical protein CJU89_0343 [Yarrowia sp. B02]